MRIARKVLPQMRQHATNAAYCTLASDTEAARARATRRVLLFRIPNLSGSEGILRHMSPTRTPTEDELALADGLFRAMRLFKAVATSAAHSSAIGRPRAAGMLFRRQAGVWSRQAARAPPPHRTSGRSSAPECCSG